MRAEPNALSWMLALSVALHLAAVAQFPRRAGVQPRSTDPTPVEVALPSDPPAAPPSEVPVAAANVAAPPSAPPVRKRRNPLRAAASAGAAADPGALTRTLLRVAATPELSVEQKRKAMLALLRTWEGRTDPEAAEVLIDQMLRDQAN